MNDCPAEVWARIFSFACTDGGKTGRSLACVNSYFGQASQDVMLQSIEIRGAKQLRGFLKMLQKIPANAKRIRHLSVSMYEEPQEEVVPPPEQMFEFLYGYGSYHQNDQKESREEHQDRPDVVSALLLQVITLLAPTLQSLHVRSHCRDHILLPISLPYLQDLSIDGPFPSWTVDDPTVLPFPHLRRLSLSGFTNYPTCLFSSIRRLAPALREFHLSPYNATRILGADLERALSAAKDASASEDSEKLPPSLKRVVVHPCEAPGEEKYWLKPVYSDMLAGLKKLSQKDTRVQLSQDSSCEECG